MKRLQIFKKILHKCWMPFAVLVILLAIVFSLFRALTPWAKQYKVDVEHHLSLMLGQPVTINDMETSWYWFAPVLKLDNVSVSDGQDHVLQFKKLLVGIDLLGSLWHWQIQPGILYVEDAEITLRQLDNRWEIDGLTRDKKMMTMEPSSYVPVLAWLLAQHKIVIKHVSTSIYLNDGSFIPLTHVNLTVVNHHGHYRLRGGVTLAQSIPTELMVLADMQLDSMALQKAKGRVYVSLRHFVPKQWRGFYQNITLPIQLESGVGDLELWLDIAKGQVTAVQSKVAFEDILWHLPNKKINQAIQAVRANLAWKSTDSGWQLTGDHMVLHSNGVVWPKNAMMIQYNDVAHSYRVFVKTLLLKSLLKTDVDWPDTMRPLLAMHPTGELHDTQINILNSGVDFLLTKFSNLSWKKYQTVPNVQNISGVLYWQPTEGRLELDGENTSITQKGVPTITFGQVNAAFDWKALGDTSRISVERFVVSHPDLLVSAHGVLDERSSSNPGNLRMTLEFATEHGEQWLAYIPADRLKPKLREWLTKDIKKIHKASGRVSINGAVADFPFDNKKGEFSVNSYLSGVDLVFAKHWPVARHIDAFLRVNQRMLEADILHASFKQVETDRINLSVSDLGLNHERLLVHGQIDGSAPNMMKYVLASPLNKQMKKLNSLDLQGTLGLDLSLDVPLFPEDDQVLVRGMLTFNKNTLLFKQLSSGLALDDLSGVLNFNEQGVAQSNLTGTVLDDPIDIQVRSIQKPHHYTEIGVQGNTSVNLLRKQFAMPLMQSMHGHLQVKGLLLLTNDPKFADHLHVTTPLQGVAIDLPAPLGKEANTIANLTLDADIDANGACRLRLNYDDRFNSDLWLGASSNGAYTLERGELSLGRKPAHLTKTPGVSVVGSLPDFNWQQWRQVLAKYPSTTVSQTALSNMRVVDIKLGHFVVLNQDFKDLSVSLSKTTKDTWSWKFNQKDMQGALQYQSASNTLSGHFNYLYLDNIFPDKPKAEGVSTLKPKSIPNLNISIDEFQLGKKRMGQVVLTSRSFDTNWQLERCEITTPDYQFVAEGNWTQKGGHNQTTLETKLTIKSLAKGLERLQISPVVGAHKGDIQFEGGWIGAIDEFSLIKTTGHVQMTLKDGRIMHFSHETEQKLGLGKLLSILSLQTIPRRLKLDFSDLAQDGYSFDVFKGTFDLKDGVLTTKDSYLDGPVAYASMKGDLDVSRHLYDIDLMVSPYITASLPVVATIAGGPIAGIATWVVSKIINDRMQKVGGYTYKVSGPWLDPVVQQVSIHRKSPLRVPHRD